MLKLVKNPPSPEMEEEWKRVKQELEKENVRLKEHEKFYINKALEWKSQALKYERALLENGVPVPQP